MIKSSRAWAIRVGDGFIGIHWWFAGLPPVIESYMEGSTAALFKTRQEARRHLRSVRCIHPKARVVRVTVTITEVPRKGKS